VPPLRPPTKTTVWPTMQPTSGRPEVKWRSQFKVQGKFLVCVPMLICLNEVLTFAPAKNPPF
jgi:hypothetical protein